MVSGILQYLTAIAVTQKCVFAGEAYFFTSVPLHTLFTSVETNDHLMRPLHNLSKIVSKVVILNEGDFFRYRT